MALVNNKFIFLLHPHTITFEFYSLNAFIGVFYHHSQKEWGDSDSTNLLLNILKKFRSCDFSSSDSNSIIIIPKFGDLLWIAVKSGKYGIQTHVLVSNTFIRSFMRCCFHVASSSSPIEKVSGGAARPADIFQTWEYSGASSSGLSFPIIGCRLSLADECSFLFDGCHFKFSTCFWAQQQMKEKTMRMMMIRYASKLTVYKLRRRAGYVIGNRNIVLPFMG